MNKKNQKILISAVIVTLGASTGTFAFGNINMEATSGKAFAKVSYDQNNKKVTRIRAVTEDNKVEITGKGGNISVNNPEKKVVMGPDGKPLYTRPSGNKPYNIYGGTIREAKENLKNRFNERKEEIKNNVKKYVNEHPRILGGAKKIKDNFSQDLKVMKEKLFEKKQELIKLGKEISEMKKELVEKLKTMTPEEKKKAMVLYNEKIKEYIQKKRELANEFNGIKKQVIETHIQKKEEIKKVFENNGQKELADIKGKIIELMKEYKKVMDDKTLDEKTKYGKISAIKEEIMKLRKLLLEKVKEAKNERKDNVKEIKETAKNEKVEARKDQFKAIKEKIKEKLPMLLKVKLYDRIAKLPVDKQIKILEKVEQKIKVKLDAIENSISKAADRIKARLELKRFVLEQVGLSINKKIDELRGGVINVDTDKILDDLIK